MSYFTQYIALVFDMFNLLEADDFGHGQDFHGTVFFGNTIATETNTSKGASSWNWERERGDEIQVNIIIMTRFQIHQIWSGNGYDRKRLVCPEHAPFKCCKWYCDRRLNGGVANTRWAAPVTPSHHHHQHPLESRTCIITFRWFGFLFLHFWTRFEVSWLCVSRHP